MICAIKTRTTVLSVCKDKLLRKKATYDAKHIVKDQRRIHSRASNKFVLPDL